MPSLESLSIAGALMMGVIMFAGVTVAMHLSNPPQPGGNNDSFMLLVAVDLQDWPHL